MPKRAGAPCSKPGCLGIVRDGVCDVCGPTRRRRDKRESAAMRGYGAGWRKLRKMFLSAHPLCAMCEEAGLVVPATDVHHVVARRDGGEDEWSNLQALCHSCHSRVTEQEWRNRRAQGGSTVDVTIVAGAPGSGKSTYVREKMGAGDLVVDVDALYAALSFQPMHRKAGNLLPFVLDARDAVLARLCRGDVELNRAWVVTASPSRQQVDGLRGRLQADRVVVMDVSLDDCVEHIESDATRSHRVAEDVALATAWYEQWKASEEQSVVVGG